MPVKKALMYSYFLIINLTLSNQGKLDTPGSLTDFKFYETMFWYSNYLDFLVNLELAEKNKLLKISSQLGY